MKYRLLALTALLTAGTTAALAQSQGVSKTEITLGSIQDLSGPIAGFGKATIGYLPDGKIAGLSKLTRLVECFMKRLQVQERLTMQVANALMDILEPRAAGVVIRCRHLCMESRGIRTAGEETVTSAMLGELQDNLAMRTEFLDLAREDLGRW